VRAINLCLLGFGNVGRAFARLLLDKSAELRERYAIETRITGVASRRLGWLAREAGFDPDKLLDGDFSAGTKCGFIREWLSRARANALLEISSLNAQTGEPAISHIRAALEHGAYAITANKGAVVHGYRALTELARAKGKRFLFEACVMGGTPVFSLFRETLPAANLLRLRGVLNSTTSRIFAEMEAGASFDAALKIAQDAGIAETDPSADIDGWDAAVKVHALATVLMDAQIKIDDIAREGIRGISAERVRAAAAAGKRIRLVARAERRDGRVVASVGPEEISPGDPLAGGPPAGSIIHFELNTLHDLIIASGRQGPDTTAYGLLADFLSIVHAPSLSS
jgi:homoserine dehydrogenase